MRRVIFAGVIAGMLMMLGVASVGAGVENNPKAETFVLMCDGQAVEVVGPPTENENVPILQVVGSNSVLVFQHVVFTFTAIDAETGEVIFEESDTFQLGKGKKKGLQDDLVTCTATFEEMEDGMILRFHGEGQALMTPRGR